MIYTFKCHLKFKGKKSKPGKASLENPPYWTSLSLCVLVYMCVSAFNKIWLSAKKNIQNLSCSVFNQQPVIGQESLRSGPEQRILGGSGVYEEL